MLRVPDYPQVLRFVGDIMTVNGTAYPVLVVKRRKYRFRFLDASLARIYEFKLMSSTQGPKAAKDLNLKGGTVAVIPGFQGVSDDGRVATLGRGGSDTSAVAIAVALEAE